MSSAKLTLYSFAQWMDFNNKDLFGLLQLPEGIDKGTLTDNILIRGGEFEVVYSDPEFMAYCIGAWSRKWYRTFDKWITALNIEYSPLENYDRKEDHTDSTNRGVKTQARRDSGNTRTFNNEDKQTLNTEDKRTLNTEDKQTLNTEDKQTLNTEDERTLNTEDERTLNTEDKQTLDTEDKRTADLTYEDTVSAYDSSSYQPANQRTETGTDTMNHTGTDTMNHTGTDTMNHTGTDTINHTGTDTMNHTGTDTMNHTGTDTMNHTGTDTMNHTGTIKDEYGEGSSGNETENIKFTHDGRIHGNIGVTTSQQMLQAELDISKWNIYEHITDVFLEEFIIPIYS